MVKGRKFQLTDAGRRAGLEAAPDFRWQAAGSRIVPAETHIDRMRCLIHLHRELARLGGLKLSKYQEQLATDIADGLDEEALAAMHDWWNYDRNALFVAGQERPNRPRLDLVLELTSKGNLAVTWRPSVINPGQRDPVCNWVNWRTEKNRGMAFVTRPSNELLFLHNVDEALDPLRDLYPAWKSADQGMIDTILLQGAVALVEELKNRLSWNFTVTMITDIFMNWNEFKSELWPDGRLQPRHVLTSWAIEDVKEREERLARAEFECFPQESGVPLNVFVASVAEADKPMPSGAAPSRDDREKRISKALLAAGYGDVIPAAVRQYWELIERFRPEFLPRPPGTDAKVVPFRKR
jgi:hypothetical protein